MAAYETRQAMVNLSTNAPIHPFFTGKQESSKSKEKLLEEQNEDLALNRSIHMPRREEVLESKRRRVEALSQGSEVDSAPDHSAGHEHPPAQGQELNKYDTHTQNEEESHKPDQQQDQITPVKPLRLNGKGGLASLRKTLRPKDGSSDVEQSVPSVDEKKQRRKSSYVRIAYGQRDLQERIRVGQRINQILSFTKITDDENLTTRPKPSPVVHPFFSRTTPKVDTGVKLTGDQVLPRDKTPPQADGETSVNPYIPLRKNPNGVAFTKHGNGNSSSNYSPRLPGTCEPLWPARGSLRIDSTRRDLISLLNTNSPYSHRGRRQKTKVPCVSEDDDIMELEKQKLKLYLEQSRSGKEKDASCQPRIPHRRIFTRPELQQRCKDFLTVQHPALSRLSTELAFKLSSYDNGECSSSSWCQKYAPQNASEVLGNDKEVGILRTWLHAQAVDTIASDLGTPKHDMEKHRRKRRRRKDEMADFIVSDEESVGIQGRDPEEGDSTNTNNGGRQSNILVLNGPHGIGKSAAVQAVAKELGFSVFELHSGTKRSGKDLLDKVGDLARNHQVHNGPPTASYASRGRSPDDNLQQPTIGFFNHGKQAQPSSSQHKPTKKPSSAERQKRSAQKQAVILLEEVDVLFEEDRQFWETVVALAQQSRRPIVLTCNDESLIKFNAFEPYATLRFKAPQLDLVADYLRLIAATEGHLLELSTTAQLYTARKYDLRASLQDLDFWCQMALGDTKGGMDWFLSYWPKGSDIDQNAERLRVISEGTFDMNCARIGTATDSVKALDLAWQRIPSFLARDEEKLHESYARAPITSQLECHFHLLDGLSAADLFPIDTTTLLPNSFTEELDAGIPMDASIPQLSVAARLQFTEGYQLLETHEDYNVMNVSGNYVYSLADLLNTFSKSSTSHDPSTTNQINEAVSPNSHGVCRLPHHLVDSVLEQPTISLAKHAVSLDYLPYLRTIAAYELVLEQSRSDAQKQDARSIRSRMTRVARSAVDGSNRKTTRREKWFTTPIDLRAIIETGGKGWHATFDKSGYDEHPSSAVSMQVY